MARFSLFKPLTGFISYCTDCGYCTGNLIPFTFTLMAFMVHIKTFKVHLVFYYNLVGLSHMEELEYTQ